MKITAMTQETKQLKKMTFGEDITTEQVKAFFFDEDALVIQPRPVYRMDNAGKRYYFTQDKEGNNTFYISVTTFINFSLPTSPQLIEWKAQHGIAQAKIMTAEAADYGTLMHIEIASLLINKTYDLDSLNNRVAAYVRGTGHPERLINPWTSKMKMDILAFAQFAIDVNMQVEAIECILADEDMGLAGAIDIVAIIDCSEKGFFGEVLKSGKNAGKQKETTQVHRRRVMIDIKSGRKGFWESHEIQLNAYRKIWNKAFPDKPVEKVFNWAPKEWKGDTPTYKLKDQTEAKSGRKFEHMLNIAKVEAEGREKVATVPRGIIDLESKNLLPNIRVMTMDEIVKESIEKVEAPEKEIRPADFDKDVLDLEDADNE